MHVFSTDPFITFIYLQQIKSRSTIQKNEGEGYFHDKDMYQYTAFWNSVEV